MASVTLSSLTKRFGGATAVHGLSLDIRDREFFVLLGPTGAGKTTTLRCIAGLEQPDAGDVLIDGQRVNDWSAAQRDVALVFQQYSLYPNFTVRENLAFPLKSRLRHFTPAQIEERVQKAAATVRIGHLLERRTDRLSGGEMQRVSIGRAIVREPRVFLMDEPLSNLDAKLRELLRTELKGLQHRLGATVVLVTHDQVEAMSMADRVGVIHKGRLVQVGTPQQIYNRPMNTFVASFVGAPAINLMDMEVDPAQGRMHNGGLSFALDEATRARVARLRPEGGALRVGIRPEDIGLVGEGAAGAIGGTIYGAENHGAEIIAVVESGGHRLRATVPAKVPARLNQPVQFSFVQDKLHFFDPQTGDALLTD